MVKVCEHLNMLGLKVKDRITSFEGVLSSVSFDLYGCIQAIVNPGIDKDGKMRDSLWFDINRLEVMDETPVMELPNFDVGPVAEGFKGAAEKPAQFKA